MKKGLFLFSFFTFISIVSIAQAEETPKQDFSLDYNKHRIGITLGASGPMGDFDDATYSNPKAGYANGGTAFELNYNYFFKSYLGIGINWGGIGYLFDINGYLKASNNAVPGALFNAEVAPYGVGYFMLNLRYQVGFTNKFYLNGSLGSMSLLTPEIKLQRTTNDPNVSGTIVSDESINAGFGFSLGGGADLYISDLISLNLAIQYFQSDFNVKTITAFYSQSGGSISARNEYTQPYSALNFTVGLGFNF